jgi:hypothetical protein
VLRTCCVAVVFGLALVPVQAQHLDVEPQAVDPSLRTAYTTFFAAWELGDIETWDQLVDADAVIKHADGRMHVKGDELEHIRGGTSKPTPRIDDNDRVTLGLSGKLAVHRYVAQSGLVTEFWWKQPNGRWVLKSYFDGFGTPGFLDGVVHA